MEDRGIVISEYCYFNEKEVKELYEAVGWKAYTAEPDLLRKSFEHSLIVLAAYEDDKLAGILRAVGDGSTIVFIQDILVLPEKQRKGIGSALLKQVLKRYGYVRQIELVTDDTPGTIAFYRSVGFQELSETGCKGFIRTC